MSVIGLGAVEIGMLYGIPGEGADLGERDKFTFQPSQYISPLTEQALIKAARDRQ